MSAVFGIHAVRAVAQCRRRPRVASWRFCGPTSMTHPWVGMRSSFRCKSQFSIGSFASPKTRPTPDPEALQRLMAKTEVDGGGGLGSTTDSEVVAKPPTARQNPSSRPRQARLSSHHLQFPHSPQDAPVVVERRKSLAFARKMASDCGRLRFPCRSICTSAFGNTPSTKRSHSPRSWSTRFAHGSMRERGRAPSSLLNVRPRVP